MSKRTRIKGLQKVEVLDYRPPFIPDNKNLTGSRKHGIIYENMLAKYLVKLYADGFKHGPWLEYIDVRGRGWNQPDFLFIQDNKLVIGEAKLKWKSRASTKLRNIYTPLIQHLYPEHEIKTVQICKALSNHTTGTVRNDFDMLFSDELEQYSTIHFRKIPK